MKSFSARVYEMTACIPRGKVATYGQIARLAGSARAARAVGRLMARNTHPSRIPCHRVVGSDGRLTGYAFGGMSAKRAKLLAEGVTFAGGRINLATSLWRH